MGNLMGVQNKTYGAFLVQVYWTWKKMWYFQKTWIPYQYGILI